MTTIEWQCRFRWYLAAFRFAHEWHPRRGHYVIRLGFDPSFWRGIV